MTRTTNNRIDRDTAEGLIVMAEHGKCNVITPFTLSGAMSPVTIAGSLAQQHAPKRWRGSC